MDSECSQHHFFAEIVRYDCPTLRVQQRNASNCTDTVSKRFIIESKKVMTMINLTEIVSFELRNVLALDESKCIIDTVDFEVLDPKHPCALLEEDFEHAGPVTKMVKVGVLTLKHGVTTGLGLNGIHVDQVMYITEKSYRHLHWLLHREDF